MLGSKYAYLFTEIAGLLIAYTFTSSFVDWKIILNKVMLSRIGIMFMIWVLIDQVAINLYIWKFSENNFLGGLFFNLPLEEYALFILHSIYCIVFIQMYKAKW